MAYTDDGQGRAELTTAVSNSTTGPYTFDTRPTLQDLIERIGIGLAQYKILLCGGAVWLADGAELLLIGSATQAVSREWDLGTFERGFMVTVVFIGIFIGNFVSGPLGDAHGRRPPIVVSYLGVFLFSVCSASAPSYLCLICARMCVGVSFGVGQPAFQALVSETAPANWRMFMTGTSFVLFSAGEIYSAILINVDDPSMEDLRWRWLLAMGALPSAVFLAIALLMLQESPMYLSFAKDREGARRLLDKMAYENGVEGIDTDFKPSPVARGQSKWEIFQQIGVVFKRELFASTLIVISSCFVLNFVFYGCMYALPQVVGEVEVVGTPAQNLIIGALMEIFGVIFGLPACAYFSRKGVMKTYLVIMGVSLIVFSWSSPHSSDEETSILMYLSYFGIKADGMLGFLVVYQYATEIYPTSARASGAAIAMAGGRLAGMVAPLAFEYTLRVTKSFHAFFSVCAGICFFNYFLIGFLPYETAGMQLSDEVLKADGSDQDNVAYGSTASTTGRRSSFI